MPNDHRVDTSLKYDEQDQTMLSKVLDNLNQAKNNPIDLAKGMAIRAKNMAAGSTPGYNTAAADAADGLLWNPKSEIMYKGFGFRRFSFDYHFAPKSVGESELVRDIIETFRYYALPESVYDKLYYLFPSEFEISFMQGQRDNPNIPRIATCALDRIVVNYSPNSVWSTLPNGANNSLSMTLSFIELELIDRTRVYNPEEIATSGY
jgi:hypothetical protein